MAWAKLRGLTAALGAFVSLIESGARLSPPCRSGARGDGPDDRFERLARDRALAQQARRRMSEIEKGGGRCAAARPAVEHERKRGAEGPADAPRAAARRLPFAIGAPRHQRAARGHKEREG